MSLFKFADILSKCFKSLTHLSYLTSLADALVSLRYVENNILCLFTVDFHGRVVGDFIFHSKQDVLNSF